MTDHEILDPETKPAKTSKWKKYGPAIFWGTIIALPAMNLTASVFYYKTSQTNLEIEKLKAATNAITE